MRITEININLKNVAIAAALIVVGTIMYLSSDILILLLISVLIAYLLNPVIVFFEKLRIPRAFGIFIIVVLIGAIVFLLAALLIPVIVKDMTYFADKLPDYISRFFAFLEKALNYFGADTSLESAKAFVVERIGLISKYILNTLTSAAASVKGIVLVALNIFLVPVLVFFLLKDFPKVKNLANRIIKQFHLEKIMGHVTEFESITGRYFRGMFIVGLVLSVLYTAVLLAIGVNGAILLGLLTGMGGMIPYVGFTVGIIVSVIMTAVQFQDIIHPVYVVIGFTIVQVLESTVITPKIVGDSLGLSPVIIIIGLMIGGALLGLIGMVIALPIAAFIKVMLDKYFFNEKKKEE